jgi:hypothetical protein
MTKPWSSWKRKKTVENGVVKLLKVDGEKAVFQFAVNEIKLLFGARPLKVEVVFETEEEMLAQFIDWIPAFTNIGKMGAWMRDTQNMKEIVRLLLFDAVVANNDRMVCNVLVGKDLRIFGIDEADCFRFNSPVKIKFRKSYRDRIVGFANLEKSWLDELVDCASSKTDVVRDILERCSLPDELVSPIVDRMQNLGDLAVRLFKE